MSKAYTLITGASSGMGALCAKQFSSTQNLIIASENLEQLEQVRSECNNPENILLWHCNFGTERELIGESLTEILKSNDAVIDKYLHFAGINRLAPLKSASIQMIDLTFNVNFFSIIEIMKVLIKKVNQKALDRVVLISAFFSERGNVGNSIYVSSKGAINSLVYTLARELAPVKINALLPGAINTPMTANLDEGYRQEESDNAPLGWGTPQDVVDYAEFLVSEKSKWITGQCLFVDGGRSTK